LITFGVSAFGANKYAEIDLRERFKSAYINLYPDGSPYYRGVDIMVRSKAKDVTVTIDIEGDGSCRLIGVSDRRSYAVVRVGADLEIDDGVCNVSLYLRDGRKAIVNIVYQGT